MLLCQVLCPIRLGDGASSCAAAGRSTSLAATESDPTKFSPETEALLWAHTVVFAHLLVTLIPGYDFTKTALYRRYSEMARRVVPE